MKGYEPKLFGYTDTTWDPRFLDDIDEKKFTYESPMEGFDPVYVIYPRAILYHGQIF